MYDGGVGNRINGDELEIEGDRIVGGYRLRSRERVGRWRGKKSNR